MCGLERARCDERGHDLGHVVGHRDAHALGGRAAWPPGARSSTSVVDLERVVRADLGAEAVLQRRDDPTAVRVVLGVGRREQHEVERQVDLVAAHLDVALLEHVEQADLDALGQVGQLVDGEDAAVRAGHEAVVQRELVGQVATLGHLDRVDLADQVGDRGVGGGQLLAVAPAAVHPLDRRVVPVLGDEVAGVPGHRGVRVVVDLGPGHDRHPLVEQLGEGADHAGLRLAPLPQEDHVVPGEQGVLELREHGVLVAEHDGEQRPRRPGCGRWRCGAAPPSPGPTSSPTAGADPGWQGRDGSWTPTYRRARVGPRGGGGGPRRAACALVRLRSASLPSVAVLALAVGVTVVVYDQLDVGGDGGDQVVSGPGSAVPGQTTRSWPAGVRKGPSWSPARGRCSSTARSRRS